MLLVLLPLGLERVPHGPKGTYECRVTRRATRLKCVKEDIQTLADRPQWAVQMLLVIGVRLKVVGALDVAGIRLLAIWAGGHPKVGAMVEKSVHGVRRRRY